MTTQQISTQEYEDFRHYLESASGIVLGNNKHHLLSSRLNHLMRESEIEDFTHLMRQLRSQNSPMLHQQVVDAMTTNETLWFRDTYPFEVLKHQLLPEITDSKAHQLRIWSAASSSGQEAYSISMTIEEYLSSNPGSLPENIQIIGSDISANMLRDADEASYDKMSLSLGISEERQKRFFIPQGEKWQLHPEVKARASFREINLLNDFSTLGKFDLIFCRNVLFYFCSELKSDILKRMAASLNPGGYLFLGSSESPNSYTDAFEMVHTAKGVVYRVK